MNEPFDLYSKEIDADPYPSYNILRESYPCFWSKEANIWILSRYEDVLNASKDWRTFSSRKGNLIDEISERTGGTLGTTDPPNHTRLRSLAQLAFNHKPINEIAKPSLEIAEKALNDLNDKVTFDFVKEFSSVVTVKSLLKIIGLPDRNPTELRNEIVLAVSTDKEKRGRNKKLDQAFKNIAAFISEEVNNRRKNPSDDFITRLSEVEINGDQLSDREVTLTTSMFLIAGVESLSSFMSIFALNLADHNHARRRISSDPNLMEQAIEESLRFNTSAQRFKRVLTKNHSLHGHTMKTGDSVILAFGSANRDKRKFPNPDNYDIDRKPKGHLGFGAGIHSCVGNSLARMITKETMNKFLEKIPEFKISNKNCGWVTSSNFRSPVSLPLVIDS